MLLMIIEVIIFGAIIYYLNNYLRRTFIDNFQEKSVFITGTDSGIGKHLALELDRKGLTVYAGCHTKEGAELLRKEASKKMRILLIDVTDNESIIAAKEQIEKTLSPHQGLWALVNNAGIINGFIFPWCTIEDYENAMDVNFYGVIRVTNIFLPLIQKTQGRIINMTSMSGRFTTLSAPYSCSKYATESYSNCLRRTMAPFGVKVSIIEPGIHSTNMTKQEAVVQEFQRQWNALSNEKRKAYGEEYKAKRESSLKKLSENPPLTWGNTLEGITELMVHAIGSVHPKSRYVCGTDAHLFLRPAATFLPDWISDTLLAVTNIRYT